MNQTVTVTAGQDDDAVDDTVTVTHAISSVDDSNYDGLSAPSVVVTVTDDEVVGVTVDPTTLPIEEGDSGTYTVVLDSQPAGDVTVTIEGIANTDLSLDNTTLTFTDQDWNTAQEVTVTAEHDDEAVDEAVVTISHTLSSTADSAYDGATAVGIPVTVTDDDTVGVTISETALTIGEGDSATYTVVLDTLPSANVTVTVNVQNGAELMVTPQSLIFTDQNWDAAQTVTINALDDTDTADEATVTLTHSVAGALEYSAVIPGSVDIDVTDDDVGVTVNPTTVSIPEGHTAQYTIVLNTQPAGNVVVTVNDSTDNTDVTADPASLTFSTTTWDTPQLVTVSAVADSDEDDDSATITHTVSGYGSVTTADDVAVTVTENNLVNVQINYAQVVYNVTEGNDVTITAVLNLDPERTFIIPLSPVGAEGATSDDYSDVPAYLTFGPGETEKEFTFHAVDDTVDDDEEEVFVGFGSRPAGVRVVAPRRARVKIEDNDAPESVTVSFGAPTYEVNEGDRATFKVEFSEEPERSFTIGFVWEYLGGGTPADLGSLFVSYPIHGQSDEASIPQGTAQDDIDDDGESFKVSFGELPEWLTLGTPSEAVITIVDDDTAGVTVNPTTLPVDEGSNAEYTVVLDSQPTADVTVTIGGTSGTDLSLSMTTLTFTAVDWNTAQTVTVTVAQDDDADGETATLTHTVTSANDSVYNAVSADSVVVNITDDDVPSVEVSFEQDSYTVAEGSSVTVKVRLDEDPERTVIIPITAADQDGASGDDYSGVPSSVTFNAGDTEVDITFSAASDSVDDDGESVKLGFGSTLPTGVSEGSTNEAVVSITDDDLPVQNQMALLVSYMVSGYALSEGSTVEITVSLSDEPQSSLTVPLTANNLSGTTAADYSGVPAGVTFNSGDTEKSFIFNAVLDQDDENAEEVILGFGDLPDDVSVGTPAQAVVTILDSLRVSFGASTYQAFEGGANAQVTVRLDSPAVIATVVPITATGMNGAIESDWTGVPPELTFGPGQQSKTFTVSAYDDSVEDDGESVELGFGTLPAGVVSTNPSTATVELMNTEIENTEEPNPDLCNNEANKVIILDAIGEITASAVSDFWTVELDPFRSYLIEAIGADDGRDLIKEDNYPHDLTLEDPDIVAHWNSDGTIRRGLASRIAHDAGYGRNSILGVKESSSGLYQIEIAGGDGGTGTYQTKVRVNNVCRVRDDGSPLYDWFGGPEGYSKNDIPADTSTAKVLLPDSPSFQFLGDNWDAEPDEDWWGTELTLGYEYTVELWAETREPEEHQATELKIPGIYDRDGKKIDGTASSGSGRRVSVVFQPDSTGLYYISVGSGVGDRTGVYRISIEETADNTGNNGNSRQDNSSAGPKEDNSSANPKEDNSSPDPEEDNPATDPEEDNPATDPEEDNPATDPEEDNPATDPEENSPATGLLHIVGSAQVGRTLTVDTSGIADADGMQGVVFRNQWISHDGQRHASKDGATGSSYTPVQNDIGNRIMVLVIFSDDEGNLEALMSAPTGLVAQ